MKTPAQKVDQILRISQRILSLNNKQRAGRYFCFYIRLLNHQPLFSETQQPHIPLQREQTGHSLGW